MDFSFGVMFSGVLGRQPGRLNKLQFTSLSPHLLVFLLNKNFFSQKK